MKIGTMGHLLSIVLAAATVSCNHRIPPEYQYAAAHLSEKHPPLRAASISGTVTDPSGALRPFVLLERMTPDFETRLDAALTDRNGRFHLKTQGQGPFYLRFRFQGFDDYLVTVEVIPQQTAPLRITLTPST